MTAKRRPPAATRPGSSASTGTTRRPVAKTPATKGTTAKNPAAKQPTTKQPTTKQPTTKQPTTKQSAAKQSTAVTTRPRSKRARRPVNANPDAAAAIYRELVALYPDAHCELDFRSPYELLAATILSAQCTDKRVNMTTPHLFAAYPTPAALAAARPDDVEAIIKSTGFFRAKAKSLIGMAGALTDRHGGEVPANMDDLVVLPGVGRKTANVVLGNAFDINVGVVVDTHVGRLAQRLGLANETDPVKVEQALMQLFPREQWTMLSHLLIWHGRRTCDARKPRCTACSLAPLCPSAQL